MIREKDEYITRVFCHCDCVSIFILFFEKRGAVRAQELGSLAPDAGRLLEGVHDAVALECTHRLVAVDARFTRSDAAHAARHGRAR